MLPKRDEWETIFNNLSKREKIFFLILFAIAAISGTLALIAIDRDYSTKVPASGGTIIEGIVGAPRFVNPLLSISDADRDVSRVVYAGLLKPDGNGGFAAQLAESYTISDDGLVYTFLLRDNLSWHDGEPLTPDDVVFTVNLAKNPAIRSPKIANWEGVTAEARGEREVIFHLKKPYSPFLDSTTLGIIPKHLWEQVPPEEFGLSELNTEPIGSGPFRIDEVTRNSSNSISSYTLKRFKGYQPEPAYLAELQFHFFPTDEALRAALADNAIDSAHMETSDIPAEKHAHNMQLPRIVGIFFNQDTASILRDAALRDALAHATDRTRIISEVRQNRATETSLPIPPGTFGYRQDLESLSFNLSLAQETLKKAGYEDTNGDGIIEKRTSKTQTTPIRFTIATLDQPELEHASSLLKDMWKQIGVEVEVQVYEQGNFEQDIIRPRNYDAILFGEALGNYPDPYAFWHTSQRLHPGLNLALYANTKVDKFLETARTTTADGPRAEALSSFQEEFAKEKPAIILYSPSYTYITPKKLEGITFSHIPLPHERIADIESWFTTTKSVWNILLP